MSQTPPASSHEALRKALPWQLLATNLPGAYWTPAPPDDLDLNTADRTTLIKHGLLFRRPRPGDNPKVQAAWNRAFTDNRLVIKRIKPEFGAPLGETHQLKGLKKTETGNTNVAWAGGVVYGGQDSYTAANGFWAVPTVSEPQEPQGTEGGWNSSSWIGIDGMPPTTDVLQAGISQKVDKNGNASYYAWYEWFVPNADPATKAQFPYIDPIPITNVQVDPGQTIWVSVQYVNNIAGVVYLVNEDTGEGFFMTLAPPTGASFAGSTAEWIMEAPDGGEPTSSLPSFTPVEFTAACACNSQTDIADPLYGDSLNIGNPDTGTQLTNVVLGDCTVTITFIG